MPSGVFKNLTGLRFNRFTVIEKVERPPDKKHTKAAFWKCQCDCGNIRILSSTIITNGISKSCGCLHTDTLRKRSLGNTYGKRYDDGITPARNRLYNSYRKGARDRTLVFELTKEEFSIITQQHCHYCGKPPRMIITSNSSKYIYNGVDRKNNTGGYTTGNSVSCCAICNRGKGTSTYDEYIAHIEGIKKGYTNV